MTKWNDNGSVGGVHPSELRDAHHPGKPHAFGPHPKAHDRVVLCGRCGLSVGVESLQDFPQPWAMALRDVVEKEGQIMTSDERVALFTAPLSEKEKATIAEVRRLAAILPGLQTTTESLGRLPDEPHRFGFRARGQSGDYEADLSFYDVADVRRFVLSLARREADLLADSVAASRRMLDERTAQARACESAIATLESQVKR